MSIFVEGEGSRSALGDRLPRADERHPAMWGFDFARGEGGVIKQRTRKGWQYQADLEARRMTQREGFTWTGIVSWVPWRDAYRVSFGGQPEHR